LGEKSDVAASMREEPWKRLLRGRSRGPETEQRHQSRPQPLCPTQCQSLGQSLCPLQRQFPHRHQHQCQYTLAQLRPAASKTLCRTTHFAVSGRMRLMLANSFGPSLPLEGVLPHPAQVQARQHVDRSSCTLRQALRKSRAMWHYLKAFQCKWVVVTLCLSSTTCMETQLVR